MMGVEGERVGARPLFTIFEINKFTENYPYRNNAGNPDVTFMLKARQQEI